ncbi:C39 family peptidase [Xylocopilactobacillus apicola]|uniref:Peptidase C39-like domain-containing protein n=1 Tax=Xylocopilactobacillus apicola TaxID=2932184 RepID=A0AAU9D150_9LACO|nr:C39 family peptidase [Xylocopilactobacillus apicola]BDR58431.1 hypothetical protein XA3_08720 [Xylocopilactobacillus apicola]
MDNKKSKKILSALMLFVLSLMMFVTTGRQRVLADDVAFVGQVSYVKGYSIRVYQVNGTGVASTDKLLLDGTLWKVFGSQDINGVQYYNVGGNQWVQAQYIKKYIAPEIPSWDGKSYVTVGYEPGYGIAVYQAPGFGNTLVSGLYLQNGTTWKVVGQRQVDGKTWYEVGTNQWVPADNVVPGQINATSVKLSVPYISQYTPVYAPWGCAGTAMAMLIDYEGPIVDLRTVQDNLPMYPTPGGQKGNVYTGVGFGYVINSIALTNYAHRWNNNVRNVTGANTETIKNLVLTGHPVLYYGYSSYQTDTNRNHCKVIVGYDNGNFLIHDPLYFSANDGAGSGGTRKLGYNNGYDNGAIYWSNLSKFNHEYAGSAMTIK